MKLKRKNGVRGTGGRGGGATMVMTDLDSLQNMRMQLLAHIFQTLSIATHGRNERPFHVWTEGGGGGGSRKGRYDERLH